MVSNPQDAEDILQNTFIKAFNGLKEFKGQSSISTWITRIAINESLMLLRKQKPEIGFEEEDADSDPGLYNPKTFVDWCCQPENDLLTAESRDYLEKAIKDLSPNLRMIFILRDIEGYSIRETVELMGVSENVVKVRLFRARLILRELLSKYFGKKMEKSHAET
jgi:RNA polymerase sigma-70 factor (ECF subfamily)